MKLVFYCLKEVYTIIRLFDYVYLNILIVIKLDKARIMPTRLDDYVYFNI
jgi:hypothetical protein